MISGVLLFFSSTFHYSSSIEFSSTCDISSAYDFSESGDYNVIDSQRMRPYKNKSLKR